MTAPLVVAAALLVATAAGILARIDGATIPAVLMHAARVFAAVLTPGIWTKGCGSAAPQLQELLHRRPVWCGRPPRVTAGESAPQFRQRLLRPRLLLVHP
ncbi:hypothetical protein [Streptomyces mirabilis]|uniref:hypothetical protein n=1 Tax=Streptomyces mirabilis TaxID=68239 RepID=UPI0036DCF4B9